MIIYLYIYLFLDGYQIKTGDRYRTPYPILMNNKIPDGCNENPPYTMIDPLK